MPEMSLVRATRGCLRRLHSLPSIAAHGSRSTVGKGCSFLVGLSAPLEGGGGRVNPAVDFWEMLSCFLYALAVWISSCWCFWPDFRSFSGMREAMGEAGMGRSWYSSFLFLVNIFTFFQYAVPVFSPKISRL